MRGMIYAFLVLLYAVSGVKHTVLAQDCDASTPTYTVDLTGNPDSLWQSPSGKRSGGCCGANTGPPDNERCVEFIITLDSETQAISFDIATGAEPSGSLGWRLSDPGDPNNCGVENAAGDPVCVSGVGPHRITFCKPGNNPNSYFIQAIKEPEVSDPQVTSDACNGVLTANGFDPSTITWSSVGDPALSYLSCFDGGGLDGCDSVQVTFDPSAPAIVDYDVTGVPDGSCDGTPVTLSTQVEFINDKVADIQPDDAVICFGGTLAEIWVEASGGKPPYDYLWDTGETTDTIDADYGWHYVTVSDQSSCPTASDSVFVDTMASPITVDAGPDLESCANNVDATMAGSFTEAGGIIWTTSGSGTFDNDTITNAIYTPSAADTLAGTVDLILTTTDNRGCPEEVDSLVLTINPTPIVDAGANDDVCANDPEITLAGSVTNAGGGRWSGGTGSFFPNDSTLNAIYTPSSAEITAGTVTLTLTSIQNGECLAVTDDVTFTITPAPTVDAGGPYTVCANNNDVSLSGTFTVATGIQWSGSGVFSSTTDPNATYTPTAAENTSGSAELILTTTGNGKCIAEDDTVIVTITAAPTADANDDQTVCDNNPDVTLAGAVTVATGGQWTSSGDGTFDDDTDLTATYSPGTNDISTGTVTLTLTTTGSGSCIEVTDDMTVTITPGPTASAGADQFKCANNANVSLTGNVTVATGGIWSSSGTGTFADDTDLTTVYTPSASDISGGVIFIFLCTTGNGSCIQECDTMITLFSAAPTVDAGGPYTVCGNNANVSLTGTISAGSPSWSGNGSFSPANNVNSTYTPTAAEISAGTATVVLTASGAVPNCAAVTDEATITITAIPTAEAGPNQIVCANNADVTLSGSVTVATGGQWTTSGDGTFSSDTDLNATYTPGTNDISTGNVTLTLTTTGNGDCNPVTDNMSITITPAPTVDAGVDQVVCGNNAATTLSGSVTVASGLQWSGGAGSFNPSNTSGGAIYTPSAAEITAGTVTLIATTTGNGDCNAETDDMTITITPAPTVDAGIDQSLCANNASASLAGTVTIATGGTWSGGSGSFADANSLNTTYTPTAGEISGGSVTLTLTTTGNGDCNAETDDIVLNFTPAPTAEAGPNVTVCANNPDASLNGSVTIATGGVWSGGSGVFNPDALTLNTVYTPTSGEISTGNVTLTLTTTGNGNCIAVTDNMTITITTAPTVDAGPDQSVCANNSATTLAGSVTVASGGVWSGSTGTFTASTSDLGATFTPSAADTAAGSVTLTLTSTGNGNCNAVTDDVVITITPSPTVDAGADQNVCADDPAVDLTGVVTVSTGGLWTGGSGVFTPNQSTLSTTYVPSASEITAGTVTLTLNTTGNGNCSMVTDDMTITISPAPTVDAGPDEEVCGNVSSVSLNGTVTNATGGSWTTSGTGSFTDANVIDAVYNQSTADTTSGSVTLTLTTTGNGVCTAHSDDVTITFSNVPTAAAGTDQTVCTNEYPVVLNGAGSQGSWSSDGSGSFDDATALNAQYTPSAADEGIGFVTLTWTTQASGACPSVTDDLVVTIPQGPTVDAGVDITECADIGSVNLSGTVGNATGGTWTTDGNGTFGDANSLNTTYTPSSNDISNGGANLILTTTGHAPCTAEVDTLVLTITPAVTVNAGLDRTICADSSGVVLNGTITTATGGQWSTLGSGTFDNDTSMTATYSPSSADSLAGSVDLVLTSTGNGTCNPVSDTVNITITPAPTVDAGVDQNICADVDSIVLSGTVTVATGGDWTTDGSGAFSPNASDLSAEYYPSAADTAAGTVTFTLTTTGNGTCNPVTDQMILTIVPAPIVNAGTDLIVCADTGTVTLSGSAQEVSMTNWTTAGSGAFSDATSLTSTYTLSSADSTAGVVTLTLTGTGNGSCGNDTDNMSIILTPAPTVDAGSDRIICEAQTLIGLNGSVTVAGGGLWSTSGSGTFVDNTDLATSYQPSAADTVAGSVTVTLTTTSNGDCKAVTDDMVIDFTPKPTVDAGNDLTVCADSTFIDLSGSVTVATGGQWTTTGTGSFSPNNATLNAEYYPSADDTTAGSIEIYLTTTGNGSCNAYTDTMVLDFTPAPTVDAGVDQTICSGQSNVTLAGLITTATGGVWSTSGSGVFSPDSADVTGTYMPSSADTTLGNVTLTLTSTGNGDCKAVTDQMSVTLISAPVADAGPDRTVCADSAAIPITGSVQVATGGQWSTSGTGTFSSTTSLSTEYTPSSADTAAGSVQLILETTGNGSCAADTDTMTLTITPAPTIGAGSDITICADSSAVDLTGTVTIASGLEWTSDGSGTFSPDAFSASTQYLPSAADTAAGTVNILATTTGNGNCNAVVDTVVLTITPAPTVNAGNNQSVCSDNADVSLSGSVTTATGAQWTTSSGLGTFTPSNTDLNATFTPDASQISSGTATLILTTTGNGDCEAVTDNIIVTIDEASTVDAGFDRTICETEDSLSLAGVITGASGGVWTTTGTGVFDPDSATLDATYGLSNFDKASGNIQLILTSESNGACASVVDTLDLFIQTSPTVTASTNSLCTTPSGTSISASFTVATGVSWSSSGGGTFSPSSTNSNVTYTPSGGEIGAGTATIVVTTTGNGDCAAVTDSIDVQIQSQPTINAGSDVIVCADTAGVDLNGSFTVVSGAQWSSSGSGAFNPSNTDMNATYVPSAVDQLNGSAVLTLTSTGNGICPAVTDQMTIFITEEPTISAGTDESICSDKDSISLAGSVTVATGVQWSTAGAGSFTPSSTDINAAYQIDPTDIAAGQVVLYATSTGNGDCKAVEDSVIISFTPAPTLDAGDDDTICAEVERIYFSATFTVATGGNWSTTGTGTFDSSAASTTVYNVTAADTAAGSVTQIFTLTSGLGDCDALTDSVNLVITPEPTVDAGAASVCASSDTIPLNGSFANATGVLWESDGTGVFEGFDTTSAVTGYVPSAADKIDGTVVLTLTTTGNGFCNSKTDTLILNISEPATVDAGVDITVCSDTAGVELDGSFTVAGGIEWSTLGSGSFDDITDTNAVYTPSAADTTSGTVDLVITTTGNGFCDPVTDTMRIILTDAPTVDAGPGLVCSNNPTVALSGDVTTATGGRWYSLGTGTFDDSLSLATNYNISGGDTGAGTVSLVLETTGNGDCHTYRDTLVINIADAPTADAGPDTLFCEDNTTIDVSGAVTNATGGQWLTTGSGTFDAQTNLTTTYNITAADVAADSIYIILETTGNGSCAAVQDSFKLVFTPIPAIEATPDTICQASGPIDLEAVITIASGVQWTSSGDPGTFSDDVALATTYTPTASDIAGGSVTITATTTGNGTCQAYSDASVVNFLDGPTAFAGNDDTICVDESPYTLSSATFTVATGNYWESTGTGSFADSTVLNAVYTPSAADTAAGSVSLIITTTGNGICPAAIDTMDLAITPALAADAGTDQTVCADFPDVTLGGALTISTTGQWSTAGDGSFDDNTSLTAVYTPGTTDIANGSVALTLTTTDNGGCNAKTDQVDITIEAIPIVDAGPANICSSDAGIPLSGSVTNAGGGQWSTNGTGTFVPGATNLNATYARSAADSGSMIVLTLTSTGNGQCQPVSDSIIVGTVPPPEALAGDDELICGDLADITLAGTVNNSATGGWTTTGDGAFADTSDLGTTYTPTNNDSLAGSISIILTTTDNGVCDADMDTLTLSFTEGPSVEAGPNDTICTDESGAQLGATVSIATGGLWSTGGSGSFSPSTSNLNAQYIPSAADTTAGSVILTITTTGNGNCEAAEDSLELIINPAPTVSAGSDITVCADTSSVQLSGTVNVATGGTWTTGGTGVFDDANLLNATYTPSASDITDSTVALTLTSTGNNGCNAKIDVVNLFINPAPTIDAGPNVTICGDADSVEVSGSVTVSSGGIWTSNGTGSFNNDTLLTTGYVPSSADTGNGTVRLFITSTGNGLCNAVTDSLDVTITDAVTITAGGAQTLCSDITSVSLTGAVTVASGGIWSSTGTGSFAPDDVSLSLDYFPSNDDFTATTVDLIFTSTGNGGCKERSDTATIDFTPIPTADAGDDQTICADSSQVLLDGAVTIAGGGNWFTSGTGIFSDTADLNGTYTPSIDDINNSGVQITLQTVANGTCNPVTDLMQVIITPEPTITASPDQTVCADVGQIEVSATITIASGVVWSSTGTGTFLPDSANTDVTYQLSSADSSAGFIQLIATSTDQGDCNPVVDTVDITITPAPTIDAGPDVTVCADTAGIELTGVVTVATDGDWATTGSGVFVPNANTLTTTYELSQADINGGTVGITITSVNNGTCNPVTDDMQITITPAPSINAGIDQTVCADVDSVNLSGTVTVATGGNWVSSGSGTYTISDDSLVTGYIPASDDIAAGVATLTITSTGNGDCKAVTDQMQITITPAPTVSVDPDKTICANNDSVPISGTITVAGGGVWDTDGTGNFDNATSLNTNYRPSSADTAAGSVNLILTTTNNGSCKAYSDTIPVTIQPVPIVTTGSGDVCADVSGIELNGTVINATGALWTSSGSGFFAPDNATLNASYVPSDADVSAGSAILTLTSDGNGVCNAESDDFTITITELPEADAGDDKTICRNASTTLVGNVEVNVDYQWFTIDSVSIATDPVTVVSASSDTSFVYAATDSKGCTITDTTNVLVIDPPVFNLPSVECLTDTILLDSDPTGVPAVAGTYQWYFNNTIVFGETADTLSDITETGTYSIGYTFEECSTFDSVDVVEPTPVNNDFAELCTRTADQITLDAGPGSNYNWLTTGETTQTITVSDTGVYNFVVYQVVQGVECPAQDSIEVVEVCPPDVYVPTAFVPGGCENCTTEDQFFQIFSIDVEEFEIRIFNRWGEVVYRSFDPEFKWDGTYLGEPLPGGVYPWVLVYKGNDKFGVEVQRSGAVTIVR